MNLDKINSLLVEKDPQASLDAILKAAADEVDPGPNIDGTPAERQAELAARYKAEADLANTSIDLINEKGNAALTAAQQALKDQATASAAATAQLQEMAATAISDLQTQLAAAASLAAARKLALGNVMKAVSTVIDVVNPLLVGD